MKTARPAIEDEATYGLIGEEHGVQLALLDEIEKAVARGEGTREVGRLLDHFVEHANAHFLSEQLLMRHSAYGAYEQHVAEHDLLMSQARRFLKNVETGATDDAREFVTMLRNWLTVHVKTTDAAFETFLEQHGGEADKSEV
jgi:hemerythrin-like metal-binding protein